MVLFMLRTPCHPGLPARDQHRAGRAQLMATTFATFERNIREQLGIMLGSAGFDPARDIQGITVNRWAHGYAYSPNPLFDPEWKDEDKPWVPVDQQLDVEQTKNTPGVRRMLALVGHQTAFQRGKEQDSGRSGGDHQGGGAHRRSHRGRHADDRLNVAPGQGFACLAHPFFRRCGSRILRAYLAPR
jgi:hypothetical protein